MATSQDEPHSFREALLCPDAELWTEAALEELLAHAWNGTWTIVALPAGAQPLGSHWLFCWSARCRLAGDAGNGTQGALQRRINN